MLKYKSRDIKFKPIFIINGGMRIISNYALKGFFIEEEVESLMKNTKNSTV